MYDVYDVKEALKYLCCAIPSYILNTQCVGLND